MNRHIQRNLVLMGTVAGLLLGTGTAQANRIVQGADWNSFTKTLVLGNVDVAFSTDDPSLADVTVSFVEGSGTTQSTFLTDAFPRYENEGDRVSVDWISSEVFDNNAEMGLAIASVAEPPGRRNLFHFTYRPGGARLVVRTFDGDGITAEVNVQTGVAAEDFDTLFIEKGADGWTFGSIKDGVETLHRENITTVGGNNIAITADGTAVGLYADMRGADTIFMVSNLTVIPDPPPAGTVILLW